ncbi:Uncharacterized protein MA16_Dca020986 [Dendrobium catenatum]|uniref:CCHC-type domain-containing protein n=1 Tax=Dendrobium catenatum TaxID=906689 RepID=A0A2I0W5Q9_9ASPA|nr:Uncharacterized protein MA16_Dca020986 [Dendrobium catenatum]
MHDSPLFSQLENGAENNNNCFSARREPLPGPAPNDSHNPELCTQGACGNAPIEPQAPSKQQTAASNVPIYPGSTTTNPFAWNKIQLVPIARLSKDHFLSSDGKSMDPEIEAVQSNIAKLDRAIVAKVMGRRIAFNYLLTELKKRWFHFGEFELVTIAPNTFICVFQSSEARDAVLSGGPWIVGGNIIGMDRWSPSATPNSLHGLHSPIWIRIPQLSLMYWDTHNITRIANMLGDPLWMDSHTSSWGRSSFARICVRIDLSQKLLPGVWINGIHGRFFQRVEYEGLTNFCFNCGFLGHAAGSCTSSSSNKGSPPTVSQPACEAAAPHEANPVTNQPSNPSTQDQGKSSSNAELEDNSYGEWNLVTRKRRGKMKQSPVQQPVKSGQQTETSHPAEASREQSKRMEEISKRITSPNKHHARDNQVVFTAERGTPDPSSMEVNLTKRQHKASKAYMEKQLLHLGPIATLPRKRRKNLQDDTGGDFVPFEEQ